MKIVYLLISSFVLVLILIAFINPVVLGKRLFPDSFKDGSSNRSHVHEVLHCEAKEDSLVAIELLIDKSSHTFDSIILRRTDFVTDGTSTTDIQDEVVESILMVRFLFSERGETKLIGEERSAPEKDQYVFSTKKSFYKISFDRYHNSSELALIKTSNSKLLSMMGNASLYDCRIEQEAGVQALSNVLKNAPCTFNELCKNDFWL